MKLDLSFLLQPPEFNVRAMMKIAALAPLSMVTSMPGKYYRSQPEPTQEMLYGLLENALGWHFPNKERSELLKQLKRKYSREPQETGSRYASLLQFHLRFTASFVPPLMHFDDYWSQHLKHNDDRHINGSRNYDYRAIPILNRVKSGEIAIKPSDIIEFFPRYYVSPTPREYVVPKGEYRFVAETSGGISSLLAAAIASPAAPLYLGSNDGWVEAEWEAMES